MGKKERDATLVYSTGIGRICPRCSRPEDGCLCRAAGAPPKGDGQVRVGRQTKGRKGSGVTVITGLPLGQAELGQLASTLKKRCGTGGTVKDGVIEIQGDHRDLLVDQLRALGWSVKKAGG